MADPWMTVSDGNPKDRGTMNTPSEYGKPFSETVTTERKTTKMVLTTDQHMEALSDYLTKHYPQFRNMNIAFDYIQLNRDNDDIDWTDILVEATAFRERKK